MVKPMDLRAFQKLVGSYRCRIETTKKHHMIFTDDDLVVCRIAVKHPEKIVLQVYVKRFLDRVTELNLKRN
jgi:hypothetical protein